MTDTHLIKVCFYILVRSKESGNDEQSGISDTHERKGLLMRQPLCKEKQADHHDQGMVMMPPSTCSLDVSNFATRPDRAIHPARHTRLRLSP